MDILPRTLLLAALVVLAALFLATAPLRDTLAFSLGATDSLTAVNFNAAETSQDGRGFRWTGGTSELRLPAQGLGPHILRLTVSAPRPELQRVPMSISLNGQTLLATEITGQVRRYALIAPDGAMRVLVNSIAINSPTYQPARDNRRLGVAVFDGSWERVEPQRWLVPAQLLVFALALVALALFLRAARLGLLPRVLTLVLFAAIALSMRMSDLRFVERLHALGLMLGLAVALMLATLAFRPCSTRETLPVRAWWAAHWPALVGFVVVTGAMLFPLITQFTTTILGFPGDAYEYVWKMQWFADALLGRHSSPSFAPQIFFPLGFDLALSEMTPAHTLLGLPLTVLFGPIVSYNAVIVASFVLTAFFTYLLALRLGASRGPAFVAGLIFAFCFRRFYHAVGHLPLMGTQWIALAIYGWEGVLTRQRMWDGFVAGLALAFACWSSWYYGVTLVFLLAAYTPLRLGLRRLPEQSRAWRPILLAVGVTLVLVLPIVQPYVEMRAAGVLGRQAYSQLLLHSALPREYLNLNSLHPLWGGWASQFYRSNGGENYVTVGWTAIALGLFGLAVGWRMPTVQALTVIALVNVVMTLGPELRLASGAVLPLPAKLVHEHVPILDGIRVWSRMVIYVQLCLALLGALALTKVSGRLQRPAWLLAGGLVLLESVSILIIVVPRPRTVDLWLRDQPDGAVVEMPNSYSGSGEFYSLFSRKPVTIGYGSFEPSYFSEARRKLELFPEPGSIVILRRWQTRYIVIDIAAMMKQRHDWRQLLAKQPNVQHLLEKNGFAVYELVP